MIPNSFLASVLEVDIPDDLEVESLGHVGFTEHERPRMLVFCEHEKYLHSIDDANVAGVITTPALVEGVRSLGKLPIAVDDPRDAFQKVRDRWARETYVRTENQISPEASIHPTASVAEHNVVIQEGAVIQPNVTILSDVVVGPGVFVGAGSVLGAAFDLKVSKQGNISRNFHDGRLILSKGVEIHSNCTLDKGNSFHGDTILGEDVKVSHQCYIGHSTQIGKATFVMANVSIAGGAVIGESVLIDPGARVCSFVKIGNRSRVTTGSVVAYDVSDDGRVTGNFAIDHDIFMGEYRSRSNG